MTTVLLVRHGETEWNRDGRFQGHADPPLTDRGREQASAVAAQLAGTRLAAVYSSDLRRAVETAEIVAAAQGLVVRTLADLREVDVGEWAGLTWEEIEHRFPDGVVRHHERGHGWEHGESYDDMARRVLRALRRIGASHPRDAVLVVVHGGTMRAIGAHIDGMDVASHRRHDTSRVLNCEVRRIAIENGVLRRMP